LVRDVAIVQYGAATRYGAVTYNGQGEVVGGVVLMLKGENFNEVIKNVKQRMVQIQKSLPEGVVIEPYIDRTQLVGRAIGTVEHNLIEGALIVIVVLVVLLGNFRAGLIVASVIPLAMLFAVSLMKLFGVSGNLMSLGAIDFGLIVDGAVIIVEASLHHLYSRKDKRILTKDEMDEEVYHSASKIRTSAAFGEIIILIVYLPILALVGIEGKMFRPMAETVAFAILGAFILSLTYVPMVSALFLNKKTAHKRSISDRIMDSIHRLYSPVLDGAFKIKKLIVVISIAILVITWFVFKGLGGEFIPTLEEGDFAVELRFGQGTSLSQTIDIYSKAEKILKQRIPEIKIVVTHIGTAEIPTDPMPMEGGDMMLAMKPKDEWKTATTQQEMIQKIEEALAVIPGLAGEVSQPMQMRFNELISGVKQDVAIKIFGDNIDELVNQSNKVALFTHPGKDAQSVLPRKNGSSSPAEGTISTSGTFGFQVGYSATTDASKNFQGKIGIRVYKVLDAKGNIIPNSYILTNDYLGTQYTNYDYQDNTYFVSNVKPYKGTAYYSELKAAPSDIDFGEKILQTNNSLQLNLSSLGQTYLDGSADPAITISSLSIVGENSSEFSASMPAKTTLNPQENTTVTVNFNPATQGLKIADLLVYYKNSQSPLRVPLYGIAKASGTTVTANYRVNSGSSTSITINGKTWSADNQYAFDNLEPFTNSNLKQIACTDEDPLYLKEQSSNADKAPFRYEFPVANGDYVVRLHFAEIYQGAPGSGINGGAGSRVMNINIENQLRLANFDVTQEVGGATAIVKNFPVTVTDGKLNINFSANVNRPMVCAVEVYSFRSAAARAIVNYTENNLQKVKVYPNPVQKRLMVQFPDKYTGTSNLQIVDATGRAYQIGKVQIQPGGSTKEFDISNLSLKPGFYYLRVFTKNKAELIKLIVE